MDVIEATTRELEQNPSNVDALLRQATAYFELEEYESAKSSIERGLRIEPANAEFKKWLRKVNAELGTDAAAATASSTTIPVVVVPPAEPRPASPRRFRHEWYQSITHVIVELFIKGVKKDQANIDIESRSLSISIKLDSSTDFNVDFSLFDEVVPEASRIEFLSTKIEIKLKKKNPDRHWGALEQETLPHVQSFTPEPSISSSSSSSSSSATGSGGAMGYPSSSKKPGNWDSLERELTQEEQNEKPEGDAALSKLFQQIFSQGSDETKRAMIKSFTESGGTVLSTNWNEVGSKKVEMTPPNNMEFHKWDE